MRRLGRGQNVLHTAEYARIDGRADRTGGRRQIIQFGAVSAGGPGDACTVAC